jgi:hypothetical protein
MCLLCHVLLSEDDGVRMDRLYGLEKEGQDKQGDNIVDGGIRTFMRT